MAAELDDIAHLAPARAAQAALPPAAAAGQVHGLQDRRRDAALRDCEELKAAERAEQKRIDEAAEELLQEQLKGESRGRRYKTIRWVLDSVAKILPPSLRRSLSPIRDRFAPPERRLTYAELRDGRGETKRKHTLAKNVTADNLWASASTRGRPR